MPVDEAFAALGDQRFISLTTFRMSGDPVSTPVWVGRDGSSLVVTTGETSGKVKRLRNNQRVEVRAVQREGACEGRDPERCRRREATVR